MSYFSKTGMTIKHKMGLFKMLFGKTKSYTQTYREKSVKILVLGKENVGKTSIINKLCGNEEIADNYKPTLYDVSEKSLNIDEYNVVMQFMELGGSQQFPSMLDVFVRQADIFILVYSFDDVESFQRILAYRDRIVEVKHKHTTELPLIVVQNKTDLRVRKTRKEMERRQSVAQWCYLSHNVSAKTEVKIYSIMDSLIEESKFIGNENDLGDVKISGRIIYNPETESKRSELYHKAPNLFKQYDNSDEKMDRRRKRSLHHESLKKSQLTRSSSFSVLSTLRKSARSRRSTRNVIVTRKHSDDEEKRRSLPPMTKLTQEKPVEKVTESIKTNESFKGSNGTISSVRSTSNASTMKDLTSSAKTKRKVFRMNKTKTHEPDGISEDALKIPKSPSFLRSRKKSLSSNDLQLITPENLSKENSTRDLEKRSRSSSVNEPAKDGRRFTRQRSVSVNEQSKKPKPTKEDIVHTTLKEQKSNETIPVIRGRIYNRSFSFTNKQAAAKLNRASSTVNEESESEETNVVTPPPPVRNNTRRKSRSHNDLSESIREFQEGQNAQIINAPSVKTFGRKRSAKTSIKSANINMTEEHPVENSNNLTETIESDSRNSTESISSDMQNRSLPRTEKRRLKKSSTMSNHSTVSATNEIAPRRFKKLCRQKSSSWHELPHLNHTFDSIKKSSVKPFTDISTDDLEKDAPIFEKVTYNRSSSDETNASRAKNWIRSFSIERFID